MDMRHKVLSGQEPFSFRNSPLSKTVKDFWAWSMSRLIADGPRGDLAEFIVSTALGVDLLEPKRGWGECDIIYNGVRIEVKCSTLLQAWERDTPPKPLFSIAKTLNCDIGEIDGGYRFISRDGSPPQRRSELYVFCLFAETDRQVANPLMLDQWEFYIVPTSTINEKLGDQRKISLQGLDRIGATPCGYDGIRPAVDEIVVSL